MEAVQRLRRLLPRLHQGRRRLRRLREGSVPTTAAIAAAIAAAVAAAVVPAAAAAVPAAAVVPAVAAAVTTVTAIAAATAGVWPVAPRRHVQSAQRPHSRGRGH